MTLIEHADRSYFPIIVVFTLAGLIAFALTPIVRRTMKRYGVVDRPNARRVNTRPIPRAGGLAVAVGFLVVALPFTLLNESADWVPMPLNITTGVQFVGYTLAVLSILGSAKVAVALLVLGVPIIDTFWIIVGRLSQRRSPFTPDRSHIHHRLLDLGLSHRNTVLFIYAICITLGILALLVQEVGQAYAFISLFILAGLILFGPTRGAFDRPDELEADAYDDTYDEGDLAPSIAETALRREVRREH